MYILLLRSYFIELRLFGAAVLIRNEVCEV